MASRVEGKGVWMWLTAIALTAALATGLAWTAATSSLSSQAGRLDTVDLALGSAAVTRAGAGQAVVIATNQSAGTASAEALSAALSELAANAAAYQELATQVDATDPALFGFASEIISLLQRGAVDQARESVEGPFQASYLADVAQLSATRMEIVAAIDSAASLAASLAGSLRIAAVVAIPAAAAFLVHLMGRRRLRAERTQLLNVVQDVGAEAEIAEELLADASHRLRTPLTSIFGLSEVLAQSKRVSGLERELVSLVHAEAAEMRRIADDILVLNQMRTGRLEVAAEIVRLPDVIDEATKPAVASGIEVKVECPEVWVLSDPAKVRHVVRNLVSNAATHGSEPIFVEVSEVDGRVECVVVDHGSGLPPHIRPESGSFSEAGHGLEIAFRLSECIGASLSHRRDGDQTRFRLAFADEGANNTEDSNPGEE